MSMLHRHQWLSRLPRCRQHHHRLRSAEECRYGGNHAAVRHVASSCAGTTTRDYRRHPRQHHRLGGGHISIVDGVPSPFGFGGVVSLRSFASSVPERDSHRGKIDHRANYARVGAPLDPSACSLSEDEICDLIRDRIRSRRVRDFREADRILGVLKSCGIDVDDGAKQWRCVATTDDVPNDDEFGHDDFTRMGGPPNPEVCSLDEGDIRDLLRERARLQRGRMFEDADGIRTHLQRSGVMIDDRGRRWRADGMLADGTIMMGRPRSSPRFATLDRPAERDPAAAAAENPGAINGHGHVYKEVGARMLDNASSVVTLPRSEIHELLRERMLAKRAREFDRADAILKRLRDAGVFVDDRRKEWRTDVLNEHGHEYTYIGEPFERMGIALTEEEVHGLMRERMKCKRERDFERAEEIQRKLWSVGVEQDDKQKLWTTFRPGNIKKASEKQPNDATAVRSIPRMNNDATFVPGSIPKMKDCKTIEEAIAMAMEDPEQMTTRRVSAFWAVVPRLLDEYIQRPAHEQAPASKHLGKLLSLTLGNIDSFSPRELSGTTLGLARIVKKVGTGKYQGEEFPEGGPHDKLNKILLDPDTNRHVFQKIASAATRVLPEFDARCLANVAYACAVADVSPETDDGIPLMDRLADRSIPLLGSFKSQELSNMLWACARLGASHSDLFREAGDKVVSLDGLEIFNEQALSNVVWSYATLKERHPRLFKKVADHILSLDGWGKFRAQTISNILWAYASAEFAHPSLFKRAGDHIASLDDLSGFRAQNLSNIPWAYATSREPHRKLFDKIADAAIERRDEFTSQGVANFLWAYATNGRVDECLFSSLAPSVERLLGDCNGQELVNVAWAYSAANVPAPSLFDDVFVDACIAKEDEFHVESLSQLHQWQLWREESNSSVELPPSLRKKCHEAFVSRGPEPSSLQDDVVAELASLGLQPRAEHLTERGYRVDALVEINGERVAVEVDGPKHFVGREPAGRTLLKRRQIAGLEGMRVASVPYWEWDELGADGGKKIMYLRLLLNMF